MAEWFFGPIKDKFINACFDYLIDKVGWQTGMEEQLKRRRMKLLMIQAVVFEANQAQIIGNQKQDLNDLKRQLRNPIDMANDVLDELEYKKLEEQSTSINTEETKKRKLTTTLFEIPGKVLKIGERVLKIDPYLNRLKEAVQKLDEVLTTDFGTFFRLLDRAKEEEAAFLETRKTGPLIKDYLLIGRGKDKESVVQWLSKQPSNDHQGTDIYKNISLLCIVGHGGMGKTTLVQHIYEEDARKKKFDLKMWVCVSNKFDADKVIADMLKCLEDEKPSLGGTLEERLRTKINNKKFLLVLDDIWEDKEEKRDISKWEKVLAPLKSGRSGSKILVTTRTNISSDIPITKTEIYKLPGLEEDDCLRVLKSHAFGDRVKNPPNGHKILEAIAGEIVKKLLGCPLAAKVIGGVLRSNLDEGYWTTVLQSNLLDDNSIDSILRLSYTVLPNHLQNCFAICCMFPQDHRYDKDDLIRRWIALGFIQSPQRMTMNDIGERYFDYLVKKSLLEKVGDDYKMHDLIHESAFNFFAQECGKFVDDDRSSVKFSETIRHLSIHTDNSNIVIEEIEKFKHLHSLSLFFYGFKEQDFCSALTEIIKASRRLRLLDIFVPRLEMIPEEIEKLIHLRYLKTNGDRLPRSLSKLYHLKYIIFDGRVSRDDAFLPNDFNNLSNLCYVEPKNSISSICGIGNLKFLQELNIDLKDKRGYRIEELKNMNDLCKLGINYLEYVKDAEEARSAKLCEKKRLADLTLEWSNTDSRNNLDQDVLDNLQPPECLKNLIIRRYMGERSAAWMYKLVNPNFKLAKIELTDCLECDTLPPFGRLPFLKSLTLSNMPNVKCLEMKFNENDKYSAFPVLEELRINEFEALEDWFEPGVAAENGCFFPCLIQLDLSYCPVLKDLPSLPSKLKSLKIRFTGWTTLNFCSISNSIPLETLEVFRCPNITSLPLADEIARLAALRRLSIIRCPKLSSLGRYQKVNTSKKCHLILDCLKISDPKVLLMEPLRSVASLKKLEISENDDLVSFPNAKLKPWFRKVSSSLSRLEFACLRSLESLPSSLEILSSLQDLNISVVPKLRELPILPDSLESLGIWACHPDLKERYREDGGSDGHKIPHIY